MGDLLEILFSHPPHHILVVRIHHLPGSVDPLYDLSRLVRLSQQFWWGLLWVAMFVWV